MWVPNLLSGHLKLRIPARDGFYKSQESMQEMVQYSLAAIIMFSKTLLIHIGVYYFLKFRVACLFLGRTHLKSSKLLWLLWQSTNCSRNGKIFFSSRNYNTAILFKEKDDCTTIYPMLKIDLSCVPWIFL